MNKTTYHLNYHVTRGLSVTTKPFGYEVLDVIELIDGIESGLNVTCPANGALELLDSKSSLSFNAQPMLIINIKRILINAGFYNNFDLL